MRLLIITDLHWGREDEAQRLAANNLVSTIAAVSDKKYDAVLLTGDLANSGITDQYDSFREDILNPLRALEYAKAASFVSVPGNHDIDCRVGTNISWEGLGLTRQRDFFNFDSRGQQLRQHRRDNFSAYSAFVRSEGILAPDPTKEPAALFRIPEHPNFPFICLNTAFFSDWEVSDNHKTPAPTHCLRSLLQDCVNAKTPLVLGHHPITWFTSKSRTQFKSALLERDALYFHGHEHDLELVFDYKGLLSLGFGASYLNPITAVPTPYYRNSFTVCELNDSLLHVAPYTWDAEHGQWRPDGHSPPSLTDRSALLANGYVVDIPTTRGRRSESLQRNRHPEGVRSLPVFGEPLWVSDDAVRTWKNTLPLFEATRAIQKLQVLPQRGHPGYAALVVTDKGGRHLVRAISAVGDILSEQHVEDTNTLLDTESFDSAILVTLGSVSDEAERLTERLRKTKPIEIFDRNRIARSLVSSAFRGRIDRLTATATGTLVLHLVFLTDGLGILMRDGTTDEWFSIEDHDETILPESHEAVYRARELFPQLRRSTYRDSPTVTDQSRAEPIKPDPLLDEESYREKSYSLHDDIQYPGLAAIGLQMPSKSLRDLYVTVGANTISTDMEQESLEVALTDLVETLDLAEDQKEQLHRYLSKSYGVETSAEYAAVGKLYEKFGNILVEGDPGSGKSIFVRSTILNYCRPKTESSTWYAHHVPVFLPLAEAPTLLRNDNNLLACCAEYARTRKLELYLTNIEELVGVGRVSFFFDGLDEVARAEDRVSLMAEIADLIENYAPLGNRFVVTSRPAAIQTVDVPDGLKRVGLRGLTDDEIRRLAERILAREITAEGEPNLTAEQKRIVLKLVTDCREVPGIRRLGRNPLLLTLLVLIYANSGPMVAKRHVVYGQAIRTLVSVRQRQQRELEREMLSEADLRRELGIIAYSIYQKKLSEIPTREELQHLLMEHPESSFYASSIPAPEIDQFLQDVSNATGIVRLHARTEDRAGDILTFMHHSFLEFYAAIRLMEENFLNQIPLLLGDSRWREVIILASGIYGDRREATDVIQALRKTCDTEANITGETLLLALECANETDVPPVGAQAEIGHWMSSFMSDGAGRVVSNAREELAGGLAELLEATRSSVVFRSLQEGIADASEGTAAAFIDLLGFLGPCVAGQDSLLEEFWRAATVGSSAIRAAALRALAGNPALRAEQLNVLFDTALSRGTAQERVNALQALDIAPAIAGSFSKQVRRLLIEGSQALKYRAAMVAIRSSLYREGGTTDFEYLDKALEILTSSSRRAAGRSLAMTIEFADIEPWLHSDDINERVRTIRLLALTEERFGDAYRALMDVVRDDQNALVTAEALYTLTKNQGIRELAVLTDIAVICERAGSRYGNIRLSALTTLGELPSVSSVLDALRERFVLSRREGRFAEFEESAKGLASHAARDERTSTFLLREFEGMLLRPPINWSESNKKEVQALLSAQEQMGVLVTDGNATMLITLATNRRVPRAVRRQAVRCFGRVARPTRDNGNRMEALLSKGSTVGRRAAYQALSYFVRRCRGRVEYVRNVYSSLERIQERLLHLWKTEFERTGNRIEVGTMELLRANMLELAHLLRSYRELARHDETGTCG